jgi:DnaK suppressor protein
MKKLFLKKMKALLLSQKQEIMKQTVKEIDVDVDGDETDEIQGKILIDMTNKFNSRNREKLYQIAEALKRIANNSYGICEDCEEQIPEKRLLINPYCQTCVDCAEDREIEAKKERGGK